MYSGMVGRWGRTSPMITDYKCLVKKTPRQGAVWQNYYIAKQMSGGGCRSYRNANIDETDMLVGQLGHVSWTTRMLYASPPVTDNQPGSAEQPQGRLGVLLSAQCTMYNVQCTCLTGLYTTHRSNTYKSGTVCLHRSHCTKKVAQHNTAQHSADNMSQS